MITGSVYPGVSHVNSWAGCKEKLFENLVKGTPASERAAIEESYRANPREFSEILEVIYALNLGLTEKYIQNLNKQFEAHKDDPVYIDALIKDFQFKAVKKLAAHGLSSSDSVLNLSKNAAEIFTNINTQFKGIEEKCVGYARDITKIHGDVYTIRQSYAIYGHCLELKSKPAPSQLQGQLLGPNTITTIISPKKLERLLADRKILVIGSDVTGERAVVAATLPDFYFDQYVESRHLYRGMENYPPLAYYDRQGEKRHTVWYMKVGDFTEKVSI